MASHLPDPLPFWVTAGLVAIAGLLIVVRRRDPAHLLLGGFFAVVAFGTAAFALFLVGVGMPGFVSNVTASLSLVLPVLLVLHHPRRRAWVPSEAWIYGAAATAVGALAVWTHFVVPWSLLGMVWLVAVRLVFPLIGAVFLLDAARSWSSRAAAGLVMLGLAFFVLSLPETLTRALRDYERFVSATAGSVIWRINLPNVLAGGIVTLVALGVVTSLVFFALRGGAAAVPMMWGAMAATSVVVVPFVLYETGSTWFSDWGVFVLYILAAALGAAGLFLSSEGGDARRGPFAMAGPADDPSRPLPDEDL